MLLLKTNFLLIDFTDHLLYSVAALFVEMACADLFYASCYVTGTEKKKHVIDLVGTKRFSLRRK